MDTLFQFTEKLRESGTYISSYHWDDEPDVMYMRITTESGNLANIKEFLFIIKGIRQNWPAFKYVDTIQSTRNKIFLILKKECNEAN